MSRIIWAATWQNQQSDCAPSEDSDQSGHPPSLIRDSLCAQWVAKDQRVLHADGEDPDQTGRMPRLIWVFAGHTLTLLVLSSIYLSIYLSIFLYVLTPEGDIRRVPVNQVLGVSCLFVFFCAVLVVLVVSERSQCLPYNTERQAR